MSQIVKSFLGVFLILFLMLCCLGIFGAYLSVAQAQNIHARVTGELEDSHYNPEVMRTLFRETEDMGYLLNIILYGEGVSEYEVKNPGDIPMDTSPYNQAKVSMEFQLALPVFDIGEAHMLVAFAR